SCSIATNFSSFPAVADRFSGVRGVLRTPSVIRPKMKPSARAICSAHSAMDHRSGEDLKFHCASESPLVASRTIFFEPSSSAIPFARSAWVSVSVAGTATRNIAAARIMPLNMGLPSWNLVRTEPRNCIALFHPDVGRIFRERVLLVLAEGPVRLEMVVVEEGVKCMVHVPRIRRLQARNAHKIELNRLSCGVEGSRHRRLIAGHAIVGQLQLVTVNVIQRNHLHRFPVLLHMEFLEERCTA